MARALSMKEVIAKQEKTIPLTGKWADAFGAPGWTGVWFVWGKSGSGKTSFVMQLCKELCKYFKGAYNSLEEGSSITIRRTIAEHDMVSVNSRLSLLDGESMVDLGKRMDRRMSPHFYVIDSFQYTGLTLKQYFDFINAHKNKLIIFISQADGNKPSGRTAVRVQFDASLKIWVEGFRAISNGRFFGPVGYYDIWPERSREYWGDQKKIII